MAGVPLSVTIFQSNRYIYRVSLVDPFISLRYTLSMSSLKSFITHARSKGMDHATIRLLLLSSGWKERDIINAMSEESLEMPVPMPQDGGSARDAFLHLLTFTALYSTVISGMALLFQYINRALPDPALGESYINNTDYSFIRWLLAVLLVSFPLLGFLWRTLHREFVANPEKLTSGVRRWLTYLTLFVTACAIIGDLIALVFSLLQGEFTLRFFLKVLVVAVLTGVPFGYYFSVLRMQPDVYRKWRHHRHFVVAACVMAVTTFVWGIILVGSPAYGRAQQFDNQRVNDFRAIQSEIYNYVYGARRYDVPAPATLPKALPKTLEEVVAQAQYERPNITDPSTGVPYEYKITSPTTFELCAIFDLEQNEKYNIFWEHPKGHHCYVFNALEPQGK